MYIFSNIGKYVQFREYNRIDGNKDFCIENDDDPSSDEKIPGYEECQLFIDLDGEKYAIEKGL